MKQPTTTVTIQAEVKSNRIVEATAKCPYCQAAVHFEFINEKLARHTTCQHYLGRAVLAGNATGFRFGESSVVAL